MLVMILLAGCGSMLRANAGPTIDLDGRVGVEIGGEVATHMLGTQIAGAPIGVRVQAVAIGDELVGFVGLVSGDNVMPGFYGRDPTSPDEHGAYRETRGYSGHLAGAVGGGSEGTLGIRAALGVGHGRGRSTDGTSAHFREAGAELAWQGDYVPHEEVEWETIRHRMTASFYIQWTRIPADHGGLDWFSSGKN